jgi:sugar phosphate permease
MISFYFFYTKEYSDLKGHSSLNLHEMKVSLKTFFSSRTYIAICAMAFVFDFILYFFLTWFPYYLETVFELSNEKSGLLLTIPWMVALISLIFGGWLSDFLFKKTHSLKISRSYLMFASYFCASASFFLLLVIPNLQSQVILFSAALGFVFLSTGPLFLLNVDLFPKHSSAALGIFISFGALAEFTSPAIIGIFREMTGNFLSSLFLTATIALIGSLISLIFIRPDKSKA